MADEEDITKFTNKELHVYIAGLKAALTKLRIDYRLEREEHQRLIDDLASGKLEMP